MILLFAASSGCEGFVRDLMFGALADYHSNGATWEERYNDLQREHEEGVRTAGGLPPASATVAR